MSKPPRKLVWFDDEKKKWVSRRIDLLATRHKPRGRRRAMRDAVQATPGGVK